MVRKALFSMCKSCRTQYVASNARRQFSINTTKRAEDNLYARLFPEAAKKAREADVTTSFAEALSTPAQKDRYTPSQSLQELAGRASNEAATRPGSKVSTDEPYHLNIYAHKHNMHITFTEPSRSVILSLSAGNIGLRKAQRSTFDAAYQLATYAMRKMAEKQWRIGGKKMTMNKMYTLRDIQSGNQGPGIEVVIRGFGPGREAFQKALLGTEGQMIRPLIKKVTDSTRLKFGGTRSPQVRRLG